MKNKNTAPSAPAKSVSVVPLPAGADRIWLTIAAKGLAIMPHFVGLSAAEMASPEKGVGHSVPCEIVVPRSRSKGVPQFSLPEKDRLPWIRCGAFMARRDEPVRFISLRDAVAKGLVVLVKASYTVPKNDQLRRKEAGATSTETCVMPGDWKPGQKLPRFTAVIPSKTYSYGRIENYSIGDSAEGGSYVGNWHLRAGNWAFASAPKREKAEKPEKPSKTDAKGAKTSAPKTLKMTSAAKTGGQVGSGSQRQR